MVGKAQDPSADGKSATSEQILTAATRLFAARGFEATSLQEIAEAVGVRKASLLYHFESKDDLRRAVLESLLSRWNDVMPRLLMAAHSGEDQFAALVDETVGFFAADLDRARLLLREGLDRPAEFRQLIATHVAPWVAVLTTYVRKGIERGEIHPDVDPEGYVVGCINLVLASFATASSFAGLVPRKRHVAEILRIARTSLFIAGRQEARKESP